MGKCKSKIYILSDHEKDTHKTKALNFSTHWVQFQQFNKHRPGTLVFQIKSSHVLISIRKKYLQG